MNEEWIDSFIEKLAEHEGTEGRKVAIEGGKGTRGYGITHIAEGLKKFLSLNELQADEMSDKDLAKQIVIYNIGQIKNQIGEEKWNDLPNSMKMITSDMYYNAGKLFPGFKRDLVNGDYESALKNTLDIVLANDPETGNSAILNGLINRRVDWYNIAAQELGLNTINNFDISDSIVEGKKTAINYNYSDGSAFTINSKADMHSQSLKKTDDSFLENIIEPVTEVAKTVDDATGNVVSNFVSDLQDINEQYKLEGKTELEKIEEQYALEQEQKETNAEIASNEIEDFRITNKDEIRNELLKQNEELAKYDPMAGHTNPSWQRAIPDIPIVSQREQDQLDKANKEYQDELAKKYGYWDMAKAGASLEWVSSWLLKHAQREELSQGTDWQISDFVPDKQQIDELLEGVNPEHHATILESGATLPEMRIIKNKILDVQEKEAILMSKGFLPGLTTRLLAAILDPTAIAAAVVTDGVMAPAIVMNKANRIQRIIRGGFAAATTNAAIEGVLVTQNPTLDTDDVLIAVAAGFVLGGTIRGLRKTKIDENDVALNKAANDLIDSSDKTLIHESGLKQTTKGTKKYDKVKTAQDDYDEAALKYEKTIVERTTGRTDGNVEIKMPDGKDEYIVTKDGKVIKCKQ